jgi:hypothetical protein
MDSRVQEMLDHHEIRKMLAEYCHGCDRCDAVHMGSVYLDDSWDDHGRIQGPGPEFARVMTAEIRLRTETQSHCLGQSLITIDGDRAGVETYFIAVARSEIDGMAMCDQLGGRYIDTLQREGHGWRIKHRNVIRDWSIRLPIVHDWLDDAHLKDGYRSDEDISYAVLGRRFGEPAAVWVDGVRGGSTTPFNE